MRAGDGAALANDFAGLTRILEARGVFEPQPAFYTRRLIVHVVLYGLSLTAVLLVEATAVLTLSALLMAFSVGQIAMVGHDAGHNQVSRSSRRSYLVGLMCANVIVGISFGFWVYKHNRHHARPNQLGHDPDVEMLVHAYCHDQLREKPRWVKPLVGYQAPLLLPLFLLESVSLKWDGFVHLTRQRTTRYWKTEWTSLLLGHGVLFVYLWQCLGGIGAFVFYGIEQAALGVYLGLLFAPNHLGMPILPAGSQEHPVLRQLITTRNLTPRPLTRYFWGPLAFQIEHHLFPNVPLNRLGDVRSLVKPFCAAHRLPYHEVGLLEAYGEVLRTLHRVSAPLRRWGCAESGRRP